MGAVLNLRPDLFGAAIAKVPYVDTLNSGLDPTLPLTVGEYEEWANPEERQSFDYIKSIAPYENVRPTAYPAMLVTGGLNDPCVSYFGSRQVGGPHPDSQDGPPAVVAEDGNVSRPLWTVRAL